MPRRPIAALRQRITAILQPRPFSEEETALYYAERATETLGQAMETRNVEDVVQAGLLLSRASDMLADNHAERAYVLGNLGAAHRLHFEYTGWLPALGHAIEVGRQSVASTPVGHPNRPIRLNNLGASLILRFERAGQLEDLEEAVTSFREAVNSTLLDDPHCPEYMFNLVAALTSRFESVGQLENLNEAIDLGRQAADAFHKSGPDRAQGLSILGGALTRRFQCTNHLVLRG